MSLPLLIAIALVVIGAFVVAVAMRSRPGAAVAAADMNFAELGDEGEARLIERDPQITWPTMFEPTSKNLDDETRLRLIHDLALVRASWCVPILERAYEEEREPALREAVLDALTACKSKTAPSPK